MKTCYSCGEIKPLTEFHKHRKNKDGLNGMCKLCNCNKVRKWGEDNKERVKINNSNRYLANSDKIKQNVKRWRSHNWENTLVRHRYYCAKRRAVKLKATPGWFEKEKVELVYQKADELNMSVDHVVPLVSDIVCGLHCWYNLQLLDQPLNSGKRNYHWPDMP